MRALTLHQPWATLIARGVKTIETRPRPARTLVGQRLAIHAGLTFAPHYGKAVGRGRDAPRELGGFLAIRTITDPRYQGPQPTGRRIPLTAQTPTLFWPHRGPHARPVWDPDAGTSSIEQGSTELLPVGAVVASCVVAEVVPIVGNGRGIQAWTDGRLMRIGPGAHDPDRDLTDQLPYGDYRPGRWAYILTDISPVEDRCPWCWGTGIEYEATARDAAHGRFTEVACRVCRSAGTCDPVPARGYQGVWEWDPTARPTLRDTPEARAVAEHVAGEVERLTR